VLFPELPKTYFYGEFGCLNYAILGHIEERQPNIIISTQPDYYKLMNMKCSKIQKSEDLGIYRAKCKGYGLGLSVKDERISMLEGEGFVSLASYLGFKNQRCHLYLKEIKEPLRADKGIAEKYISISCRNRSHEQQRNLAIEEWHHIISIIRRHSDLPIIAHGMELDTYDIEGIRRVSDIEESIAYMNKSVVFIASMSGIAQFASNCACGIIQIGDPSRHIEYDPFNKGAVAVRKMEFKRALLDFV